MKNYSSLLIAFFAAAVAYSGAAAETFTVDTGGASSVNFTPTAGADYDIDYTGADAQYARLGSTTLATTLYSPASINLLTDTSAGDLSNWNFLVKWDLDIGGTESGVKTVLRNNTTDSSKYIHFQIGTITVKNSNAGSSATALIDLGGSYLHVKGNTSGQKATLNIDVDTAVNSTYSAGTTIALRINQNGTLNIAAGKTLTVNPKMSVGGGSYTGALNLGSGSTLTINDALFFYQNSAISMGSGSAINGTGSISFAAAGSYDLSGAISASRVARR